MRQEASDWLAESEVELAVARDLTAAGHYSRAVFHARQSVEAALKAAIVHLQAEAPPREHGLLSLAEAAFGESPGDIVDHLDHLDPHYTATRYPTPMAGRPSEYYSERHAQGALEAANEAVTWLRERIRAKR